MKKKFAKSLLFASIAITLTAPLSAQELSLNDLNAKKPAEASVVQKGNEANVSSNSQAETPKKGNDIKQSEISEVDALDRLTTLANQGSLELQILNQQVQRQELEKALKEDSFQKRLESAMASLSAQFQEKEKGYMNQIASLQAELQRQRRMSSDAIESAKKSQEESQKTENSVFVTSIVGVGSNLTASVYYEDKVIDVREGMEISKNLSVKEIRSNGVVFKDGKNEAFVALTNEEYAFSQTFNKQAIELMEASLSGNQKVNYKR